MTTTFHYHALEKLLKSNDRAHSLYLAICRDCDEEGSVLYTFRDVAEFGRSRRVVLNDLVELSCNGFLDFTEDTKGFHIKLTAE